MQSNDASNDFFLALAKVNDRVVAGEYYRCVLFQSHGLCMCQGQCTFESSCARNWVCDVEQMTLERVIKPYTLNLCVMRAGC